MSPPEMQNVSRMPSRAAAQFSEMKYVIQCRSGDLKVLFLVLNLCLTGFNRCKYRKFQEIHCLWMADALYCTCRGHALLQMQF